MYKHETPLRCNMFKVAIWKGQLTECLGTPGSAAGVGGPANALLL